MPIDYNAPKKVNAEDFIENPHNLGGIPSEQGYNADTNTMTVEVENKEAKSVPDVQSSSSEISMDHSTNYGFDYSINAIDSNAPETSLSTSAPTTKTATKKTTTPKKTTTKKASTTKRSTTGTKTKKTTTTKKTTVKKETPSATVSNYSKPNTQAPLELDTSLNITPVKRSPRKTATNTSAKTSTRSKVATRSVQVSSPVTLDEKTSKRIEIAKQPAVANIRQADLSNDITTSRYVAPTQTPVQDAELYGVKDLESSINNIERESEISMKESAERASMLTAKTKAELTESHKSGLQHIIDTKTEATRLKRKAIETEANTQINNEKTSQYEARLKTAIARSRRKLVKEEGKLEIAPIKAREKLAKAKAKTVLEQEKIARAERANEREAVRQKRLATKAENSVRTAEKRIDELKALIEARTTRDSYALEREEKKVDLEKEKLATNDTYREEISIKAEKVKKLKEEKEKQKNANVDIKILDQKIKIEDAKKKIANAQLKADTEVGKAELKTTALKTATKKQKTDLEVEKLKTKQHAMDLKVKNENAKRDIQLQAENIKQEEVEYRDNVAQQKIANENTKRQLGATKLANSEMVKNAKQQTKKIKANIDKNKVDAQVYALETKGLEKRYQTEAIKNDAQRAVEAESYRQDVIDQKGILVDQKVKHENEVRALNSAKLAKSDAIAEAKFVTEQHKASLAKKQHAVADAKIETEKIKNELTKQAIQNEANRQASLENLRASLQKSSMQLQQKANAIAEQKQQTKELVSESNYESPRFTYVPQETSDRYVNSHNDFDLSIADDQRNRQEKVGLVSVQDKKAKETDPKEKPKNRGFLSRIFSRNKNDNKTKENTPKIENISIDDPDVEYYQDFEPTKPEEENNIFVEIPEKSSSSKGNNSKLTKKTTSPYIEISDGHLVSASDPTVEYFEGNDHIDPESEKESSGLVPYGENTKENESTALSTTAQEKLKTSFQAIKDRIISDSEKEGIPQIESKNGLVPAEIEEYPIYTKTTKTSAIDGKTENNNTDNNSPAQSTSTEDIKATTKGEGFTSLPPDLEKSNAVETNKPTENDTLDQNSIDNDRSTINSGNNGNNSGNNGGNNGNDGNGTINGVLPNGTPFQINNNIYNTNNAPQDQTKGTSPEQAPQTPPTQPVPSENRVEPIKHNIKPEKPKPIEYKTKIGKNKADAVIPTVTIAVTICLILFNALFFHSTLIYIFAALFGLVGVIAEVKPHLVLKSQLDDVKKQYREALVEKYKQKEKQFTKAAQKVTDLDNQIDMKRNAQKHLQFERNKILNDVKLTQAKKNKQIAKLDRQLEILERDIGALEINRNGWLAEIKLAQEKADLKEAKTEGKSVNKAQISDLKDLEKELDALKSEKTKLEKILVVASPADAEKIKAELKLLNERYEATQKALIGQRAKQEKEAEEHKEKIDEIKDAIKVSKDQISARKQKNKSIIIKPEKQEKVEPIIDAINNNNGLEDFKLDDETPKNETPRIGKAQPFYSVVPFNKSKASNNVVKNVSSKEHPRKSIPDVKSSGK